MSRGLVNTHAGDDSDGKIWGIEGMNLLFILTGLLISIGLVLLFSRHHSLLFSVGVGVLPFLMVTVYVFAFRQGRPKAFDTDWLETRSIGSGWMPALLQPHNPRFAHERSERLVH